MWNIILPLLAISVTHLVVCVTCINSDKGTLAVPSRPRLLQSGVRDSLDTFYRPRRLQRSPNDPRSICDGLCNCTEEKQIFLNVVCNFTQNKEYILDERTPVPTVARTFHVDLGSNAQLLIRGRVFRQLNRISIDGGEAGGRQQIDFGSRAFHDNTAPFPEIDLKHAQTLNIHGNAFQGDFKLNVANVDNMIVHAHAFQNTSFVGHFSAVKNLRFEKDAFLGTRNSQIEIIDTNVGLLERMDASMHEIKLKNCRIDAIKSNTFDVVSIKSIILDNCDINVIETNFTTNKLLSEYLGIVGCRIGTIQANAIANSGFSSIEISRNKIEVIELEAISATAINLTFAHNEVTKTGHHWLAVREWGTVEMINNSFGHFDSIEVLGNGRTCHFNRNAITRWTEGSLKTMARACRFQDNVFSKGCTCSFEWLDKLSPGREDLKKTSYCQIENLMHCFNASTFNAHKFHQLLCGESPSLDCKKTLAEKKVKATFLDPNNFEKNRNNYDKYLYLLAGSVCVIVVIVILLFILRINCRAKPPRSDLSATAGGQVEIINRQTLTTGRAATINKGTKAFSGHDRAVVDLALEKLRVKHPMEVFQQVDTYTRKLMTEQLSETEKVLTIGEIVRLLDECDNIGDDFLAFTDLLYRHLDENHGPSTTPHHVAGGGNSFYAEPVLISDAQPETTIISTNMESESHIYAEPNSAQQPLLKTEYSLPMDRSEQATNVYADPIQTQRDKSTRIVSPYAIGNQLGTTVQPPNLPDVLSRTVPGKAVSPPTIPAPKLNTFGKSNTSAGTENLPGPSRGAMAMYSIPQKGIASSSGYSSSQRNPLQRDNSSSSSNSSSNHSGGSDITFKIDDVVDVGN